MYYYMVPSYLMNMIAIDVSKRTTIFSLFGLNDEFYVFLCNVDWD